MLSRLRTLVPRSLRQGLRKRHRQRVLRRSLRRLRQQAADGAIGRELVEALRYGYGNRGWSAEYEYLEEIIRRVRTTDGPILECGCGLTTLLVLAVLGEDAGRLLALEHNAGWAERVAQRCAEHGLPADRVLHAPLRDYGGYAWYGVDGARLPRDIQLVICDGPPSDTKGGRTGLLPQLHERFAQDCIILVDDMGRAADRDMVASWVGEYGGAVEVLGAEKPYGVYVRGR